MARGWRRVGIVLSVIWFFGFGLYLWGSDSPADKMLRRDLLNCNFLEEGQMDALQYISDPDKRDRRRQFILHEERACDDKVEREYLARAPSPSMQVTEVVVANLASIALGWLIVCGCVAVVRRIRRGFQLNKAASPANT